jgi:hypothetical protein
MLPCHILYNTFYSHIGDKSTIVELNGAIFFVQSAIFEWRLDDLDNFDAT